MHLAPHANLVHNSLFCFESICQMTLLFYSSVPTSPLEISPINCFTLDERKRGHDIFSEHIRFEINHT